MYSDVTNEIRYQEYEYYMNLSEQTIRKMSDAEFIRFQNRKQWLINEAEKRNMAASWMKRTM